jgi:hypothetical protein
VVASSNPGGTLYGLGWLSPVVKKTKDFLKITVIELEASACRGTLH